MAYEPEFTISAKLQGAMNLLRPLLEAGMVEKSGGKKTGRYFPTHP
jgi:hypothetical protein